MTMISAGLLDPRMQIEIRGHCARACVLTMSAADESMCDGEKEVTIVRHT